MQRETPNVQMPSGCQWWEHIFKTTCHILVKMRKGHNGANCTLGATFLVILFGTKMGMRCFQHAFFKNWHVTIQRKPIEQVTSGVDVDYFFSLLTSLIRPFIAPSILNPNPYISYCIWYWVFSQQMFIWEIYFVTWTYEI